jgi:hypothetical protein
MAGRARNLRPGPRDVMDFHPAPARCPARAGGVPAGGGSSRRRIVGGGAGATGIAPAPSPAIR